jgi:hypothetical protein
LNREIVYIHFRFAAGVFSMVNIFVRVKPIAHYVLVCLDRLVNFSFDRLVSHHTSGKAGGLKDCEPLEAVENPEPPKGGGYSNIFS